MVWKKTTSETPLKLKHTSPDSRAIMSGAEVIATALATASGRWALADKSEVRLTPATYATAAEALQAFRIRRYSAAYEAANGAPVTMRFERGRFRTFTGDYSFSAFTGAELDGATETLERRVRESGK